LHAWASAWVAARRSWPIQQCVEGRRLLLRRIHANPAPSNQQALGADAIALGELDQHITAEDRNKVTTAMRDAKKEYVDIVFSNADHGFFCDARKSYEPLRHGFPGIRPVFLDTRMG